MISNKDPIRRHGQLQQLYSSNMVFYLNFEKLLLVRLHFLALIYVTLQEKPATEKQPGFYWWGWNSRWHKDNSNSEGLWIHHSLCALCVYHHLEHEWQGIHTCNSIAFFSMMIGPIALIWCVCCGGEDVCGRYNKIGEIQQKVWFTSCWTARGTKMWCFTSSARNYGRHTHVRNYPVLSLLLNTPYNFAVFSNWLMNINFQSTRSEKHAVSSDASFWIKEFGEVHQRWF